MKRIFLLLTVNLIVHIISAQGVYVFKGDNIISVDGKSIEMLTPSSDSSSLYLLMRDSSVVKLPQQEVDSLKFYEKEVNVITKNVINITRNSVTLSGEIENLVIEPDTIGFLLSTINSPTAANGQNLLVETSDSFSTTVSNLKAYTKYYYRTYAIVAGKYHYGDVMSFTTLGYSMGDLYPNDDSAIGIVVYVYSNGISGKVVSLTTNKGYWRVASNWPSTLGSNWRLPTKAELQDISSHYSIFSNHIPSGFYWSSTIYDSNVLDTIAWVVTLAGANGYCGYPNGYTFYHSNSNTNSIMAIKYYSEL